MDLFELHVCKNGSWRRLDAFQDRETAMFEAKRLEQARRFSALKILRETYDDAQNNFSKNLIYSWSEEREKRVKKHEEEQYLERRRQERNKIQRKSKVKKQSKIQKIMGFIMGSA